MFEAVANWLAMRRLKALGDRGFTVSICYGPCGPSGERLWSVDVLEAGFNRPFAARSFSHAVAIACHEIEERRAVPSH